VSIGARGCSTGRSSRDAGFGGSGFAGSGFTGSGFSGTGFNFSFTAGGVSTGKAFGGTISGGGVLSSTVNGMGGVSFTARQPGNNVNNNACAAMLPATHQHSSAVWYDEDCSAERSIN
jgi:hypothetical protein